MQWRELFKILRIPFWGFLVHVILLCSVFEIHFRSPVLNDLEPVENDLRSTPADRLVLFSGDGIRARTFFHTENGTTPVDFLRKIIEKHGVWGVSHAAAPTESRPGHVAIISGMNEDPSAIFKGWQDYIVDFDSVLNRSYASFSWGSPDILQIFARGSKHKRAYNYMYSSSEQEFSGSNSSASKTSLWVANNFERFIKTAKQNPKLIKHLHSKRIMFFFHFLGPDTAGHTFKPRSREYIHNIAVVDKCVKRIHDIIVNFYNDSKTSFIFTSDHGMTDWGSHGAGSDDETLTPIITWGAGLSGPKYFVKYADNKNFMKHDYEDPQFHIPREWNLSLYHRFDIKQVDIAPLMAILIGVPIPSNSIGIIPVDFLVNDYDWILDTLRLNVLQLKKQFDARKEIIQSKVFNFLYVDYPEPFISRVFPYSPLHHNKYVQIQFAIDICQEYLEGINFYQNYFSDFLMVLLMLMLIGWIFNLIYEIINKSEIGEEIFPYEFRYVHNIQRWDYSFLVGLAVCGICFGFLFAQSLPFSFYCYSFLTIGLWTRVLPYCKQMLISVTSLQLNSTKIVFFSLTFICGLELLALAFEWRNILFYLVNLLILFWGCDESFFFWNWSFLWWALSAVVLSVFPLLPTVGEYASIPILLESILMWLAIRAFTILTIKEFRTTAPYVQMGLLLITSFNVLMVEVTFLRKTGLYLLNQIVSWALSILSIYMLNNRPRRLRLKFIHVCHCLCVPFLLLSSGHEGLFLCSLFVHLHFWIALEQSRFLQTVNNSSEHDWMGPEDLKLSSFRIAFFFLVYIVLAFFGFGNVASFNSFDPAWVRGFITTFSPFTMMSLIIFKNIIPIFVVVCALRVVLSICKASVDQIFCIVLLFCDVIAINFFLTVTNQGSWLEIGTSLTRFILLEVLTLLLLVLYGIAVIIMPEDKRPILTSAAHSSRQLDFDVVD